MKFIKTALITILIYTICGISYAYANSIEPGIRRVTLSQGERKYESVIYNNQEDSDIRIQITPYGYNPQTDEISDDKKDVFLKADTDTITVKANSSYEIKYEIYPLNNLEDGSYFNILSLTPQLDDVIIQINPSIAQLVILDIVTPQNQVKGVTTNDYTAKIEVVRKGIPFILPLKIKYIITNNSNYLLTPQGRVDIFNEKNTYKSIYIYLNEKNKKLYPNDTLEVEVPISTWHISDIFLKRIVKGEVYNGVDGIPKPIEIEIPNYILEFSSFVIAIILSTLLAKSLSKDMKKRKLKHT